MPATSMPRTPEGRLIRRFRKQKHLPIPAAAKLAGISEAHWGQVERGWRTLTAGEQAEVNGTPDTVALMARTVGIPAQLLEDEGERPDAAAELRALGGQDEAPLSGDEERAAVIVAGVRELYPNLAGAAEFLMGQLHKPLPTRERELRALVSIQEEQQA